MKLKDLLAVLDSDMCVTIHQDGEMDGHYALQPDSTHYWICREELPVITADLMDLDVLGVSTSYTKLTDLFIHIELPDRPGDRYFWNPPFPKENDNEEH